MLNYNKTNDRLIFVLSENIPSVIKHNCWSRVLKVLRCLIYSSIGFQMICDSFAQKSETLEEAFNLFLYGLMTKGKLIFI